jgi:hypothetical protein
MGDSVNWLGTTAYGSDLVALVNVVAFLQQPMFFQVSGPVTV